MTVPRNARIAVIGAGVSGLTFAATLERLGFFRVKVLERDRRIGGKCCTVDIAGRAHDLGATMGVALDYDQVEAFARASGVRSTPFPRQGHFDLRTGRRRKLNPYWQVPKLLLQAGRYYRAHRREWRGVDGLGLELASKELHRSWAEMVRARGYDELSERMLTYRTGYGYGFDDEVPAAMYANLIRPRTIHGLLRGGCLMWEGGTQGIWEGVARGLDVATGVAVERIRRSPDVVELSVADDTGSRALSSDYVVLAADARSLLPVLDADEEETRTFSAIRTYPYATFAVRIRGLSEGKPSVGYLAENMGKSRFGHPMAWVKRYADDGVFVFHLFAPPEVSDDEILTKIAGDVRALRGEVVELCATRRWNFFPHFAPEDFGYVRAVDARQGRRRTVVLGEAFSFATMARVSEHAERIARRFAAGEFRE